MMLPDKILSPDCRVRQNQPKSRVIRSDWTCFHSHRLNAVPLVVFVMLVALVPGCSLGVMFGKMVTGDPLVKAEFRAMTRVDLSKGKHTVLVFCTTPETVESELATLKFDLIDGVTRRMKLHGVKVINPDRVADWIDENGGTGTGPSEIAKDFDADYIVRIDVDSFRTKEINSPELLRGTSSGFVRVFKVDGTGTDKVAHNVYTTEFKSVYPAHQPISQHGRTSVSFHKDYVDRVCEQLAQRFYDHRPGNDI